MTPFFSIIIPTFNSEKTLDQTLESVSSQSMRDFELVISDGASTDKTIKIVESFIKKIPQITISSKPDSGVYDAINKAIEIASGKWIFILGSDDQLATDDILKTTAEYLKKTTEPFAYGNVLVRGNSSLLHEGQLYDGEFTVEKILQKNICQQAIFYRRDIFSRLGNFNTRYRTCADWDFALRAAANFNLYYMPITISIFSATGLSSNNKDLVFNKDRLFLIIRYFRLKSLRKDFIFLRWEYYDFAKEFLKKRQFFMGISAYLIYVIIGINSKISSKKRQKT